MSKPDGIVIICPKCGNEYPFPTSDKCCSKCGAEFSFFKKSNKIININRINKDK